MQHEPALELLETGVREQAGTLRPA
jgi:hypothetical protein